jgi:hypothetical protein
MNKRSREQLKAAIANDLFQAQGEHSPTRELLRQYASLEVIATKSAPDILPEPGCGKPVENSLAPHATVAPNDSSPWHGATVAQDTTVASGATVARYAEVKGELRVPNTINFSLFPTLDPFAKAVYYQLFLLSHGFKRDRCIVGLAKLATMVLMSLRKVQDTVAYLEKRGLIKRVGSALGGTSKGNIYQVMLPTADTAPCATVAQSATLAGDATVAPHATLAPEATVARHATNKDDDDDDKNKRKSSSKEKTLGDSSEPVENHRCAAAPRERQETGDRDFVLVRAAYEKATGNRWNKSDSEAYSENRIEKVPVDRIISTLEAVARRTPAKINSFNYFVQEIVAIPDSRNRVWKKKQLEKIVRRIRDSTVGHAGYSAIDFLEDVKCACAREGVRFDDDIFNELVG